MKLSSMLTKSSWKIFVSFAFGDEDTQKHRHDEEALVRLRATHMSGPG
jgi:hypothetical protein